MQVNDVFDVMTLDLIDEEFLAANQLKEKEINSCIVWKNDILAVSERPISKWIQLLKTASFGRRIVHTMETQQVMDFLQLEDVEEDFLMAFNLQQWQIDCILEWRNQCLAEVEPEYFPWEGTWDDTESVVSTVISSLHTSDVVSGVTSEYESDREMMQKLHTAQQGMMVKDKKIEKLLAKVERKKEKIRDVREEMQSNKSLLISRDATLKRARHQLHIVIAERVMCRNTLTSAGENMVFSISNLQALLEGQIMSCEGKMADIRRKYMTIIKFVKSRSHSKAQEATVQAMKVEIELLQDSLRNAQSEHDRQKRGLQKQVDILSGVNAGSIEQELSKMIGQKEQELFEVLMKSRAAEDQHRDVENEMRSVRKQLEESNAELERTRVVAETHEKARSVLQQKVGQLMNQIANSGKMVNADPDVQSDVFDLRQQQHQAQIAELEKQVRTSMQSSSQEIIELRNQVAELEKQKQVGLAKFKELAEENARFKSASTNSNLVQEHELLLAFKEEMEKKSEERQNYIRELEDKLRSASMVNLGKDSVKMLESEVEELSLLLDQREDQIKALEHAQASLAKGNSQLEEKIVDLKAQLMDAETARARISHTLQQQNNIESPKAQSDLAHARHKLTQAQVHLAKETEKYKRAEQKIQEYHTQFEQLQQKMDSFQKAHQKTIQEKKNQISDLQKSNMEQTQIIDALTQELKEAQSEIMKMANAGGSQEIEHQQKIKDLNEQLEKMREIYEDSKIEINRLESQLSGATQEASSKSDSIQSVVDEQSKKIAGYEKKERKMKKQVELLVRAKEGAEKELTEAQDQLTKMNNEQGDIAGKVEKLKQDKQALKSQLQFKSKHTADLQEQIDSLKSDHKEEVEAMNSNLKKEKESMQKGFKQEKRGLERSVKFLSQKTEKMENAIRKEYDQCQNLKAALSNIRDKQVSMKEVIAQQMLEARRTLKDAFKESKAQYEKINDTAKREMGLRKKYWNIVQDLRGNVRVFCRVRPLLKFEKKKGYTSCLDFPEKDQLNVALFDKRSNQTYSHFFEFDKVYPPQASQDQVCMDTSEYIQSVMDGYHVSIFAFGQTGSGKTYTMMGPQDNPGVNRRALSELFAIQERRKQFFEYEVQLSLFEIYNDKPRDLLAKKPKAKYEVKDDEDGNPHIPGLKSVIVACLDDVLDQIDIAEKNRHVANTKMNTDSSRSHMCLQVSVEGLDTTKDKKISGRLYLVDLAGSERVGKSGVTGDALTEAKHINKSLSALGDVMAALQKKEKFIPYRNSTLTKVMQNALSPNGKTVMFVNICPTNEHVGETLSSLKFAKRVAKVELGAATASVKNSRSRKGTMTDTKTSSSRVSSSTKSSSSTSDRRKERRTALKDRRSRRAAGASTLV